MSTQQFSVRWCCTILICLLLGSCSDHHALRRLETIAQAIDADPEQAWYMLDSIDCATLRGEARALYALLSTQADYQCYVPLTSDSLILTATTYPRRRQQPPERTARTELRAAAFRKCRPCRCLGPIRRCHQKPEESPRPVRAANA